MAEDEEDLGMNERTLLVERLVGSPRYSQLRGKVKSFYGSRSIVDPDDIEGELNLGIMKALQSVKMNVGDPMEYLLNRGYRHVQMHISAVTNAGVIEECLVCGKQRPYRRNPCYTCDSRNFLIHPRFVPLLTDDDGSVTLPLERGHRTKPKMDSSKEAATW